MSLDVSIGDFTLELKDQKGIAVTFQVWSILDPNSRSGGGTNKFNVPKTKLNNEALGFLLNMNSTSNLPYTRTEAKVIQNGVPIVPNGFAIIDGTGADYEITIYSGNVSFFDLIKGKNVGDMDWGSHVFDLVTATSSFSSNEDYIYALVEWGDGVSLLDNTTSQNIDALFPLLFIKSVLEKIATDIDFELKGSFTELDVYDRLLLSINKFGFLDDVLAINGGIANNVTLIDLDLVGALSPGVTSNHTLSYNTINWPAFVSNTFTPDNFYVGNLEFSAKIRVTAIAAVSNIRVTINLRKNGIVLFSDTFFTNGDFTFDLVAGNTNTHLIKGDDYTVDIDTTVTSNASQVTYKFEVLESTFKFEARKDIKYLSDIDLKTFFDVKQSDVLTDILKMYSLVIQTDEIKREVHLTPLNDLEKNLDKAIDWSDKIDLTKVPTIKYRISSYAQENFMRYGKDENVITSFADNSFTIEDENLQEEKDVVQLSSVASNKALRVGDEETPLVPFQTAIGNPFDQKKSRILLLNKKTRVTNFKNTINGDNLDVLTVPFSYFQQEGKSDSLDFGSLIPENYSTLLGMVNKAKLVRADFTLKEIDVNNIDFSIPRFLDIQNDEVSINGYFYINKILNFKENSKTNVELIRL